MKKWQGAIDIGSNSILLLILDEKKQRVVFESRITRLGKNLDENKMFEQSSMEGSFQALKEYKEICLEHGINFSEVRITATEAARVARNVNTFLEKVKKELNGNIDIISGDQEAYYSALGVVVGDHLKNKFSDVLTLMDIGGGSTELIKVRAYPFEIIKSISLPMGSVRATDWIQEGVLEDKLQEIINDYNVKEFTTESLIGVAGTMTSLMNMIKEYKKFQLIEFDDTKISFKDFEEKMSIFSRFHDEELLRKFPFLGKRAKSIIGGYKVSQFLGEKLGITQLSVSFKGLVYGLIIDQKNDF